MNIDRLRGRLHTCLVAPHARAVADNGRRACLVVHARFEAEEDLLLVQSVAKALVSNPNSVIAGVNGWTVGAGLEWMLCADVVIAAESARFKLPEASLGVFVTGGLSATLPATIGLARAKAMALLGEVVSASQALDWGLVWKVVAAEKVETESRDISLRIASLAPQVAQQFKRVFNLLGLATFDAAQEHENVVQRVLGGGESSTVS